MSSVTILLEDTEAGMVAQTVSYAGKFDAASQAHQYCAIMLKLASDAAEEANKPQTGGNLSHLAGDRPRIILS